MKLREDYKRPCLGVCPKCGKHGAIIFEDGSHSGPIVSIEGGQELLEQLFDEGTVSSENRDRIEDQLNCSEFPNTNKDARSELLERLSGELVLGFALVKSENPQDDPALN